MSSGSATSATTSRSRCTLRRASGTCLVGEGGEQQEQPERDEREHAVDRRERREVVDEHLSDREREQGEPAEAQRAVVAAQADRESDEAAHAPERAQQHLA